MKRRAEKTLSELEDEQDEFDEIDDKIDEIDDIDEDDLEDNNEYSEEEEDDDEDYDDDDSGYQVNKKKKSNQKQKKKKKFHSAEEYKKQFFFADQAVEDTDEEEEDDYENQEEARLAKKMQENIYKKIPTKKKQPEFLQLDEEQIDAHFREKMYQDQILDNFEDENSKIHQQGSLPTMKDPKVFAVRCKFGMERNAAAALLNKFYFHEGTHNEILIYSATFIEKFPGYIYIEADKEVYVREAIKDMKCFEFGTNIKINIILPKEVPMIYTHDSGNEPNVEADQWVRVKKGLYEGDLAKIMSVDYNNWKATVKIVPRLWPEDLDEQEPSDIMGREKKNPFQKYKNMPKPPQKLLTQKLDRDNQKRRTEDFNMKTIYRGKEYMDGFLIKKISFKNLISKGVVPKVEELNMFLQGPQDNDEIDRQQQIEETLAKIDEIQNQLNVFEKGDRIKIVEGDLKTVTGVVLNTNQNDITVRLDIEEINEPMIFQPNNLIKHFVEGNRVKIQSGYYEGKCGLIHRLIDKQASVILENIQKEVTVMVNNLKISNEVTTEVPPQFANIKKFDLIHLQNYQKAGIVLKLEKDNLTVLDEQGQQCVVNYFQIDKKIDDRYATIKNDRNQIINLESRVKVVEGMNKEKTGTVKHIYKQNLFLFNTEFQHTAGIFVEIANNCYLISQNINNKSLKMIQSQQSSQQKGKDNLLGKICIVIKGSWKGYQGKIKDADSKNVRLELQSKCKIITLPRDQVRDINQKDEGLNNLDQSLNYNSIQSKTPVYKPSQGNISGQSPFWNPTNQYENVASPGWYNN